MNSLLPTLFNQSSLESLNLFDEFFNQASPWNFNDSNGSEWPEVNVSENEHAVVVKVAIPGVKQDELELIYQDGLLMIRGEKHNRLKEESETLVYQESRYGKFSRLITLSSELNWEQIEASLKEGLLVVTVPKNIQKNNKKQYILANQKKG